MDKIKLIIGREYMTKIKSRTFILLTILGPLLYIGLISGSVFFAQQADSSEVSLLVVDQTGAFTDEFKKNDRFTITVGDMELEEIERFYQEEGWKETTLFIPKDIFETNSGVKLFYTENPGLSLTGQLKDAMNGVLRDTEMKAKGIDKELAQKIQSIRVGMETKEMGEDGGKSSNAAAASVLAFGSAFLLYLFIFLYGSMVLRGVQEEKTSRISEVIISSVKPFQLMMGKIIGNALLGFTQFAIWIVLVLVGTVALAVIFPDAIMNLQGGALANSPQMQAGAAAGVDPDAMAVMLQAALDFNILETLFFFIIYFIGGYLLYSSLFAAVAAAVDGQQDLQQFMLPIALPLIFAMMMLGAIMQNPNSGIAVTFSMFPLTSPIVMMARIPFGIPWYEKLISVVILIITFMGSVNLSGKIYRVGLLSYGAKPSWKQMWKWLRYKG